MRTALALLLLFLVACSGLKTVEDQEATQRNVSLTPVFSYAFWCHHGENARIEIYDDGWVEYTYGFGFPSGRILSAQLTPEEYSLFMGQLRMFYEGKDLTVEGDQICPGSVAVFHQEGIVYREPVWPPTIDIESSLGLYRYINDKAVFLEESQGYEEERARLRMASLPDASVYIEETD